MRVDQSKKRMSAAKAVPDAVIRVKVRLVAFPQGVLAYKELAKEMEKKCMESLPV